MLTTISFPAFATHEEFLYGETKKNMIEKLKGNYGFKRYGRDGYKTVIEDSEKRYVLQFNLKFSTVVVAIYFSKSFLINIILKYFNFFMNTDAFVII